MSNLQDDIPSKSKRLEDLQSERPILGHQVLDAVQLSQQQKELQRIERHNFPADIDYDKLVDLRKKWSEKMRILRASSLGNSSPRHVERKQKQFSLDCEMVGVRIPQSTKDVLKAAYVCVVDNKRRVVYLSYVSQKHRVSNFHTSIHGIKRRHLDGAPSLEEVQRDLSRILTGNILVGQDIKKDLKALEMQHPINDQRDTQLFFEKNLPSGEKKMNLKLMALVHLHREIQNSSHDPVEDALAAMDLYLLYKDEIETKAAKDLYLLHRDEADSQGPIRTGSRKQPALP